MAVGADTRIKALVVDDAAFMRRVLVEILSSHEDIDVVGVARHGKEALDAVESLDPDVITLDVDMPVMDGLTTIKHLMVRRPRPVIMVSGMADQGRVTFEALKLGAVDFFEKPSGTISLDMKDAAHELGQVVRIASRLNPSAIRRVRFTDRDAGRNRNSGPVSKIVVVFAMDGACGAFIRMMSSIDSALPVAVVAMQSVTDGVLESYAGEFNKSASWEINACTGGNLHGGRCYISGFGKSWRIEKAQDADRVEPASGRESADSFLMQCAENYGPDCMAVVLGGALNPAPVGFSALYDSGARIVALAPDASVSGQAASELLRTGMAEAAADERDIRIAIQGFARQV